MNDFTHIIYCPFTGVGKLQYKSDEWFKDRIQIFKKYTLQSLKNQTSQNFILWVSFREQEEDNPLTATLWYILQKSGIPFVFTYKGLMYHDDRNEDRNKNLIERISDSVSQFKDLNSKILLTRLDSDDLLHTEAVSRIQEMYKTFPDTESIVFTHGFVYNKDTNEIAEWNPTTNPPFHTIVFDKDVFLDGKKHKVYYKDFTSHEDITRIFKYKTIEGRNYCVFTHNPDMHISTTWEHRFKGKLITDPELKAITLKKFSIQENH